MIYYSAGIVPTQGWLTVDFDPDGYVGGGERCRPGNIKPLGLEGDYYS